MRKFGHENAQNWDLRKPHAAGLGGVVASQNVIAAEVGAQVLRDGGNAIDAAIATSFAVSVVEPWMSGLGGGGYMLVYLANEDRVRVVDFGMIVGRVYDIFWASECVFLFVACAQVIRSSISASIFRHAGLPNLRFSIECIAKVDFSWKSFLVNFGIDFYCFLYALGPVLLIF